MKEVQIEVFASEAGSEETLSVEMPSNFISVGNADKAAVAVYILQDVYLDLDAYAKADISKEVGCMLVGDWIVHEGKCSVIICACIEARYAVMEAASLTFTHQTWADVHQQMEEKYPDKRLVGWQHTHPGYGVFLSGYDMFIQENFFDLPGQVAYVIDPLADRCAFFGWKDGAVVELPGFYVYAQPGNAIVLPRRKRNLFRRINRKIKKKYALKQPSNKRD